jgi:hypothetical protein
MRYFFSDASGLSLRERRIMEVVFAMGEATVNQVVAASPDVPTPMDRAR